MSFGLACADFTFPLLHHNDVLKLIDLIRDTVDERLGVELEPEIEIW